MTALDNILEVIAHHPVARGVALLLAARAAWTLVSWRRCMARMQPGGDAPLEALEVIEARRQALWNHSWRFLLVMLAGIGLAISGLHRLAESGSDGGWALLKLAVGMYLFMTEPVRREIADAEARLAAAAHRGPEAQEIAFAILRDSHAKLVLMEVGAAALLALAILALNSGMAMS